MHSQKPWNRVLGQWLGLVSVAFLTVVQGARAADAEVAEMVRFETRANAAAKRNHQMIPIEHYEIPLVVLESDLAQQLPVEVKDSLIFQKDGKPFVRWIINPEDTKWHREVEKWLVAKGLSTQRHQHFRAYMTASRSYILEDPITRAQFSAKVSTDYTGGAWRDKKLPMDDARQVRMVSDYVRAGVSERPLQHAIVMDEPAMFGIAEIDQAFLIRTLNGLDEEGRYYLPGFSAVHEKVGAMIARKNGAKDIAQFWNENYNQPLARALAEFTARFGLTYDSPHSQNFLVELDEKLKPTGRIILRDFGDTYATAEFLIAKGRRDFLKKWEKDNILKREIHISVGLIHGNVKPSWLSESQYMAWGRDFFEEYERELAKQTGVPRSQLQDQVYVSGRYFSKTYSVASPEWNQFLGLKKSDVSQVQRLSKSARQVLDDDAMKLAQDLVMSATGVSRKDAAKLLTKCMQQFKNLSASEVEAQGGP
ncbi:MAG: hypothetical protein RJB38_1075 [Pseudomonadota bacterium]